jgi:hypothetical protein
MRGEAEDFPGLETRFVAGSAARTASDTLLELGVAFELEVPLGGWDDLRDAVPDGAPIALLVLDSDQLLADEPSQLAPLLAALRSAAERAQLRVIFQARELDADAEAVLSEFGVIEIT